MAKVALELTGQKFERLKVTRRSEFKTAAGWKWYCDCDCGTKDYLVVGSYLTKGNNKSCGCLRQEMLEKKRKEKAAYREKLREMNKKNGSSKNLCKKGQTKPEGKHSRMVNGKIGFYEDNMDKGLKEAIAYSKSRYLNREGWF